MQIFWNSIKYVSIMTNSDEETEKILDIFKDCGINDNDIRDNLFENLYGYSCSVGYNATIDKVCWTGGGRIKIDDINEVYIIS